MREFTKENFTYSRLGSFHKNKHYCLTYKIHAKMKKLFLLTYFNVKTGKYQGTINAVFETRDLAKGYARACDNDSYKFVIAEVEFIKQYEER